MRSKLKIKVLLFAFLGQSILACTSINNTQTRVRNLVAEREYAQASALLGTSAEPYGKNSKLLYLLDRAMVLHLSGNYNASIGYFEQAKREYDELYTLSVSHMTASFFWNDYAQAYRGEDFERVLINIFQAINYIETGKKEDALVEARDVDSILQAINVQYGANEKNVYSEDAFARLLMGVIYESSGTQSDLEDACVDYYKAAMVYEKEFSVLYGVYAPEVLKENFLRLAGYLKKPEFAFFKKKWSNVKFMPFDREKKNAMVYFIHYSGTIPGKHEGSIVLPLSGGQFTKLAFPVYDKNVYIFKESYITAKKAGLSYSAKFEVVSDISRIAVRNLEDKRARLMLKAASSSALKYWSVKEAVDNVERKNGKNAANWVNLLGNLYSLYSPRADLRSWQTLPSRIEFSRLILEPGAYKVMFNAREIDNIVVSAGETRFIIIK